MYTGFLTTIERKMIPFPPNKSKNALIAEMKRYAVQNTAIGEYCSCSIDHADNTKNAEFELLRTFRGCTINYF